MDSLESVKVSEIIPSQEVCEKQTLQNDDYYETISADGSICEDNSHVNDNVLIDIHDNDCDQIQETMHAHEYDRKTSSFLNSPFVPNFDFPASTNYGNSPSVNSTLNNTSRPNPKPNFDFSIPPPNYDIANKNMNTTSPPFLHLTSSKTSLVDGSMLNIGSDNLNLDTCLTKPVSLMKEPLADWLDENGDPVKGAFDNIKTINSSEKAVAKGSKVEYVFYVREMKNIPVSKSSAISSDANTVTNTNALSAAGSLDFESEKLNSDLNEEEKKLYLASKSGSEYKIALQATLSTSQDPSVSKTVAEKAKKELLDRLRKNTLNEKSNTSSSVAQPKEEPKKTQEEAALESQAVSEILKEIQRGAARAKEHGALGWQKCPVPVTNKTFLRNTLVSTLREPYKPPRKKGRFHVGLHNDKFQSTTYDDSDSQSSRSSRSQSTGRSTSHSYSSHRTDDEYHERSPYPRGRGRWPHASDQFYNEWAAYYGYEWYGAEAYSMYYDPESWPADPYMYFENPEAWQGYGSFYGPQNINLNALGRGIRGRGRGRGWNGNSNYSRNYNCSPRSRSSSSSRSLSHGRSEKSLNGTKRSHSKKHKDVSRSRSRSMSTSENSLHRKTKKKFKKSNNTGGMSKSPPPNSSRESKKKKKKHKKKSKKSKHKEVENKSLDSEIAQKNVSLNEDERQHQRNKPSLQSKKNEGNYELAEDLEQTFIDDNDLRLKLNKNFQEKKRRKTSSKYEPSGSDNCRPKCSQSAARHSQSFQNEDSLREKRHISEESFSDKSNLSVRDHQHKFGRVRPDKSRDNIHKHRFDNTKTTNNDFSKAKKYIDDIRNSDTTDDFIARQKVHSSKKVTEMYSLEEEFTESCSADRRIRQEEIEDKTQVNSKHKELSVSKKRSKKSAQKLKEFCTSDLRSVISNSNDSFKHLENHVSHKDVYIHEESSSHKLASVSLKSDIKLCSGGKLESDKNKKHTSCVKQSEQLHGDQKQLDVEKSLKRKKRKAAGED
ncbi:E3 ubiquitin-protein ligase Topors [Biomphalaria glabrata]|nr:E3 ubiquitin-protein ligase Topors [Biomphalaria glabrata]